MQFHKQVLAAACVASALMVAAPAAFADGPGVGTPTVVSVGDSAISGEAGRWAGNSNDSYTRVDALGPTAYYDNASNTAETIPGCHRSKSAEIHIGGGVGSANLACSGAQTSTTAYDPSEDFKPGLDFYDDGAGHIGQAKALQQYATTHNVKMVVALIGANNYGFADIVTQCLLDWASSPTWWKDYCNDDSSVTSRFTPTAIANQTTAVKNAFLNLRTAMRNAGYADNAWTLVAQTYTSPLPRGSGNRYPESGYSRQTTGGCGMWNNDANWAYDYVVPTLGSTIKNALTASGITGAKVLEAATAFNGRRLCETGVDLIENRGMANWTAAGAVDQTEWVSQIRTTTTFVGPYQLQEDLHPSYWGQKGLRNCVRQVYNGGAPQSGTCTHGTGLNGNGEPNMSLVP